MLFPSSPGTTSMQFDKIVLLWVDLLTMDQKSSVFLLKKSLHGQEIIMYEEHNFTSKMH